jgi:hypothetical protein
MANRGAYHPDRVRSRTFADRGVIEFQTSHNHGRGLQGVAQLALLNFRIAQQMSEAENPNTRRRKGNPIPQSQKYHVTAAIKAFVSAISLGTKKWSASVQQDMLNFLTCLF